MSGVLQRIQGRLKDRGFGGGLAEVLTLATGEIKSLRAENVKLREGIEAEREACRTAPIVAACFTGQEREVAWLNGYDAGSRAVRESIRARGDE